MVAFAMAYSLALAALAALIPGAGAVGAALAEGHLAADQDRPSGLRGAARVALSQAHDAAGSKDDPPTWKDSEIIEGKDCGHVKAVISKYSKASKVGKYAGVARGAISSAEAAAETVDAAATQAREIGAAFEDADGNIPEGIKLAAEQADRASADATDAAAELETELGTFKGKITSADFSGEGVKDADIVKLQDLTKTVVNATKFARETAVAVVKKAEKVKEERLKDSGTVAKIVTKVMDAANPTIKEATDVGQKAGYAADDAALLLTKAEKAITGLDGQLADAGDQEPVLQAFIDDLTSKKEGVTMAKENVTEAVTELDAAKDAMKANVTTIKETADAVLGGGQAKPTASEDLTKAEIALDTLEEVLSVVKSKAKTLMERQAKLQSKVEDAEKKLPPPGP